MKQICEQDIKYNNDKKDKRNWVGTIVKEADMKVNGRGFSHSDYAQLVI